MGAARPGVKRGRFSRNAATICDLNGPFHNFSAGGSIDDVSVTGGYFRGNSDDGPVEGGELTFRAGSGITGFATTTVTHINVLGIDTVKVWKYIYGVLMGLSGCVFFSYLWLLEKYAYSQSVHLAPTDTENIRYHYSNVVFYISSSQDKPLQYLSILFWVCLITLCVIAVVRGDTRGRMK